jgi:hypothetical protein
MASLQWQERKEDSKGSGLHAEGDDAFFIIINAPKESVCRVFIVEKGVGPKAQTVLTNRDTAKEYCEFLNDGRTDIGGNDMLLMMIDNAEALSLLGVKQGDYRD